MFYSTLIDHIYIFRAYVVRVLLITVLSLIFGFMFFNSPVVNAMNEHGELIREEKDFFENLYPDKREVGYYSVRNEADEREIFRTARIIHTGDEYIDQDNRHFRITRIVDDIAWAVIMEETSGEPSSSYNNVIGEMVEQGRRDSFNPGTVPVEAKNEKIGVYHSHGAESYVPSDGDEFIEEGGGIIDVGKNFVRELEERGIEVIHSTNTHVPHDAGAYNRSRRTAEEIMKDEQPVALFDIHRDAVPEDEYLEEVKGEERIQVLLVVGRQNQNVSANKQFAEDLKATSDEQYPGLVKGIFMARGNYNQDMNSRMMLLEIGSHENNREQAEESAALFAGVVADYLGLASQRDARGDGATPANRYTVIGGGINAGTILWMLLLLAGGGFAFVLISTGSWEEAKSRIRHFFGREFADVIKGPPKDEPGDDNEHDH